MSTAANRGKTAESKVKDKLTSLEAQLFAHHRFPDAHAGSFVSSPADFMFCSNGVLTMLEVKQVDHDYRLPYKNFKLDQAARMRNWKLSGAKAAVFVYFTPLDAWRAASLDYFTRPEGTASWDMRNLPVITLDGAFSLLG